jgi:competence protein ComEA
LAGIGSASAKKIIAGSPYSSVGHLSKAGIPAKRIEKINPLATIGAVRLGRITPQPATRPSVGTILN